MRCNRLTANALRFVSLQQFLSKYGFIKPVNWEEIQFEKEEAVLSDDSPVPEDIASVIQEGASSSRMGIGDQSHDQAESFQFTSALEEFQRVSGLPVTGAFDDATKAAMNEPRCGVPDEEEDMASSDTYNSAVTELSNATTSNNTASNSTNENVNGTGDWRPSSTVSHEKLRLKTLLSKARRKREVDGLGHMAFSKKVLKWRLIGEGYSSQLSIDDQRYIFRLAFRMWSEVSPLEFEEDSHSPLEDIDIRLGFGTGAPVGLRTATEAKQ